MDIKVGQYYQRNTDSQHLIRITDCNDEEWAWCRSFFLGFDIPITYDLISSEFHLVSEEETVWSLLQVANGY